MDISRLAITIVFIAHFLAGCYASLDNTTCWGFNGMEASEGFVCPNSLTCCNPAATCLSNRLCHNAGESVGEYIRGPCVVWPYDPTSCGAICLYNESTGLYPRAEQCEDGSWCCNDDPQCCQNGGSGIWLDETGDTVTIKPTSSYTYATYYGPEASSPTSSSTLSSSLSSSSATYFTPTSSTRIASTTSTTTSTHAPPTGLSTGAKAGIGTGVGVGCVVIIAFAIFMWMQHHGRRSTPHVDDINSLQSLTADHKLGAGLSSSTPSQESTPDIKHGRHGVAEVSGQSEVRELSAESRLHELPGSLL